MKRKYFFWISVYFLTLAAISLQSCSTDADEREIPQDARLSQAEFQAVMNAEQWTGAADAVLAEIYQNGNAASGKFANNECYQTEYSETGFTVTFGNCVLNGTDNANGSLVVTYGADTSSASFTAVYEGFFVGEVELNGTRTFTLVSDGETAISMSVTSDMVVTLADDSTIAETGTKTLSFTFGETLEEISFSISGNWNLTMDGNSYAVDVLEPLTGNFGCEHLVSGVMELTKNGLVIEVDLGDGTCDDQALVTYPNGATETITL